MKIWKYIFGILGLLVLVLVGAIFTFPDNKLHLIACSVGEGDAILVVYGKTQILIDGGPNNKTLQCLSSHLPFWDREIELVVLTHPEADHFTGLVEVFRRYKVNNYLANSIENSSQGYQLLKKEVGSSGAKLLFPKVGMKIRIGLIHLDVLWPLGMNEVQGVNEPAENLNNYSIVLNLSLGNFDALLTGDISPASEEVILTNSEIKDVEYIKVPHHGSKNGLIEALLTAAKPELAVISVGKNQWGHPHQEIINMLEKANIKTLRTDLDGEIEIETDGKAWWIK
jgi:competence protein ComEC